MIHGIGVFGVVPDMNITLDKDRYFEETKKEYYIEINLLEQFLLMKAIYTHIKSLPSENFNRILEAYKKDQPEYMLKCVEQMINELDK